MDADIERRSVAVRPRSLSKRVVLDAIQWLSTIKAHFSGELKERLITAPPNYAGSLLTQLLSHELQTAGPL